MDFRSTRLRDPGVINTAQGRPLFHRQTTANSNAVPTQSPTNTNSALTRGDSVAGKHQPDRSDSDLWDLLVAG